jgi:hypothetical protein
MCTKVVCSMCVKVRLIVRVSDVSLVYHTGSVLTLCVMQNVRCVPQV